MTGDKFDEARRRLEGSDAAKALRARRVMSEPLWFVSPDGENPAGPHAGSAVIEMYASGELPADFLLWRDGMADWLMIDNARNLRSAIEGGPGSAGVPTGQPPAEAREPGQGAALSMSFDVPRPTPEPRRERTDVSTGVARSEPGAAGSDEAFAVVEQISSLVIAHMNEINARVGELLATLNDDQQRAYLAFELGALEYYRQSMLSAAYPAEADAVQGFFTLLVHHASEHYPQDSEAVIALWHELASERGMLQARKLGFHSVADGMTDDGRPKRGHYAVDYLREALGVAPAE